ncbi:MAG: IS200/IS605 family transposase [Chitinophagales bacterium]|jgi:putative transposase
MPNTYAQIHIHFIFVVKFRLGLIDKSWKENLYKYITGIVQNNLHKMIKINGVGDHVHMLVGLQPNQSMSELMKDIKQSSSKWINENKLTIGKFEWQQGYAAFSYSKSQLPKVIEYIENQELHHQKKTFKQEYIEFLTKFEVDYNEDYIFKDLI